MTTAAAHRRSRNPTSGRAVVPLLAALSVTAVSWALPLSSPMLMALVLGAILANTRLNNTTLLQGQSAITKQLLRWGIVLLGLRLPVSEVLSIGWSAVVITVATVTITYTATGIVGRRLGLPPSLVTLIAAGFSICGAAAIAAVSDAVKPSQRDVALAVALVTIFGTMMIGAVPALASLLALTSTQSAIWAGASIHEVAQVVAAGSLIGGGGAVAIATTIKLGRVALLAPTYAVAARKGPDGAEGAPVLPWFVMGFAAAVLVRSLGVLPGPVLHTTDQLTTLLLAAGMFGLGLGLRLEHLRPVPLRALVLASFSTLLAAGSSLALVMCMTS